MLRVNSAVKSARSEDRGKTAPLNDPVTKKRRHSGVRPDWFFTKYLETTVIFLPIELDRFVICIHWSIAEGDTVINNGTTLFL